MLDLNHSKTGIANLLLSYFSPPIYVVSGVVPRDRFVYVEISAYNITRSFPAYYKK